jgi:hypothetical protein
MHRRSRASPAAIEAIRRSSCRRPSACCRNHSSDCNVRLYTWRHVCRILLRRAWLRQKIQTGLSSPVARPLGRGRRACTADSAQTASAREPAAPSLGPPAESGIPPAHRMAPSRAGACRLRGPPRIRPRWAARTVAQPLRGASVGSNEVDIRFEPEGAHRGNINEC